MSIKNKNKNKKKQGALMMNGPVWSVKDVLRSNFTINVVVVQNSYYNLAIMIITTRAHSQHG